MIGKSLGQYHVTELLGQGGMGEVYRARDSKLDRDVAIKLLHAEVARDPERVARFQREAKVLASVNHPNIAALYGIEEADGQVFLVMELVEGTDLSHLIARGPVSVDETIRIATQLARGLENAHEKGIVHRDLKPSNVMLTPEDDVKVLDFGLARIYSSDESSSSDLDESPTITAAFTTAGVILGTAAYMSPEQARGRGVDRRTDIWAFGVILWEMLTGERLFAGETVSDTLAAVLTREVDTTAYPAECPDSLRHLISRCLERDPRRRLRDIGEARLMLEHPELVGAAAGADPKVPARKTSRALLALPWVLLAAALALGLPRFFGTETNPAVTTSDSGPAQVLRFSIPMQRDQDSLLQGMHHVGISPDGSKVVFCDNRDSLWMHDLATEEQTVLGEGFFDFLFFARGGERMGLATPSGIELVRTGDRSGSIVSSFFVLRGAAWTEDDRIVSNTMNSGLYWIDPRTGAIDSLTKLEPGGTVRSHRWPAALPGNRGILYTASGEDILSFDDAEVFVLDLRTMESRRLVTGSAAKYARSGHLLWSRDGVLLAAPFDLESLRITGETVAVIHDLHTRPTNGSAPFDVSDGGTLAYVPGPPLQVWDTLEWVDREGNREPIETPRYQFLYVRVSPDGKKLAVTINHANGNIWIWDLDRRDLSRLSLTGSNRGPTWSSDNQSVFFYSYRGGQRKIYQRRLDGSEAQRLSTNGIFNRGDLGMDVSPDGERLVYVASPTPSFHKIHVRRLKLDEDGVPLTDTDANEGRPRISPDGNWLAYVSDMSGRNEIYVRPFPQGDGQWKVSTVGASNSAAWAPDGSALYWMSMDGNMMEATFQAEPTVRVGRPRRLFGDPRYVLQFDVGPDGRFLMIRREAPEWQPDRVRVVVNWFEELKRLVPTDATP